MICYIKVEIRGRETKSSMTRRGHKLGMLMYGHENIIVQQIKTTINN